MSEVDLSGHPMSKHISELADQLGGYTRGPMVDWATVRDHFKWQRRKRGMTQKAVAIQGAVDQGAISKLEADPNYMPSVMTFIGAIHGLGYPNPSEFFREIEQLPTASGSGKRSVFVSHASEGDPVSATAAVSGGGAGPTPFDSFRDALRNFLINLQVVAAELERAEATATHPAATPPRRSRRPARPARHR